VLETRRSSRIGDQRERVSIPVAPSLALAPYVGLQVRVTGTDHNGTIGVEKAEVAKDGNWEEIDLKSKM